MQLTGPVARFRRRHPRRLTPDEHSTCRNVYATAERVPIEPTIGSHSRSRPMRHYNGARRGAIGRLKIICSATTQWVVCITELNVARKPSTHGEPSACSIAIAAFKATLHHAKNHAAKTLFRERAMIAGTCWVFQSGGSRFTNPQIPSLTRRLGTGVLGSAMCNPPPLTAAPPQNGAALMPPCPLVIPHRIGTGEVFRPHSRRSRPGGARKEC